MNMAEDYPIEEMVARIAALRQTAEALLRVSGDIEAVRRNLERILANVKMLELNVSDVAEIL